MTAALHKAPPTMPLALSRPPSLPRRFGYLAFAVVLTMSLSACLTTSTTSPIAPDVQRQDAIPLTASFTQEYPVSVAHLGFGNDGRQFFAALKHRQIDFFDSNSFKRLHTLDVGPSSLILGLGFIDDTHFYVGYADQERHLKVYAVSDWQAVTSHQFERHAQNPIIANRDVALYEETLLNWRTGQIFHANRQSHPGRGRVFLTADSHVVSPETNGWILIEDPVSGESAAWNAGDGDMVIDAMDTADGRHLVTYNIKGLCRVWRRGPEPLEVGRCGEATWGWSGLFMASQPNYGRFAVASSKEVRVWNLDRQSGDAELHFDLNSPAAIHAIALAPTRLALGTETGTVEVWDLTSRTLIGLYRPDDHIVQRLHREGARLRFNNLAFSPDGRLLLAEFTRHLVVLPLPK